MPPTRAAQEIFRKPPRNSACGLLSKFAGGSKHKNLGGTFSDGEFLHEREKEG